MRTVVNYSKYLWLYVLLLLDNNCLCPLAIYKFDRYDKGYFVNIKVVIT